MNVEDINDNLPVFTRAQYSGRKSFLKSCTHLSYAVIAKSKPHLFVILEISTTALPGASILTVQATDNDFSPEFRTVSILNWTLPHMTLDCMTGPLCRFAMSSSQTLRTGSVWRQIQAHSSLLAASSSLMAAPSTWQWVWLFSVRQEIYVVRMTLLVATPAVGVASLSQTRVSECC